MFICWKINNSISSIVFSLLNGLKHIYSWWKQPCLSTDKNKYCQFKKYCYVFRNLAAEGRQKKKDRTRGNRGSGKKLATANCATVLHFVTSVILFYSLQWLSHLTTTSRAKQSDSEHLRVTALRVAGKSSYNYGRKQKLLKIVLLGI
jgi:hypothetical protein